MERRLILLNPAGGLSHPSGLPEISVLQALHVDLYKSVGPVLMSAFAIYLFDPRPYALAQIDCPPHGVKWEITFYRRVRRASH